MLKPEHPTVQQQRERERRRRLRVVPDTGSERALKVKRDKPVPTYRTAGKGEPFSVRRSIRRAGLNLRDEGRHTGGIGSRAVGSTVEELGVGNFGGIGNFVLVVIGGILGLVLLDLLVSSRGSTIVDKSLQWTGGLINRVVSPTDPLVGTGHSTASTSSPTSSSATTSGGPTRPTTGGVTDTGAPTGRIVPIPGNDHTIDSSYVKLVGYIEKTFGVTVSSGYRTRAQNSAAGGAQNSDHLTGAAADFAGTPAAMQRLYQWALKIGFPYVESPAQAVAAGEGAHVHISFFRPPTPHPGAN